MTRSALIGGAVAAAVVLAACGAPAPGEADPGTDTLPPAPPTTVDVGQPTDPEPGPEPEPDPDPDPAPASWDVVRVGDLPGEGGLAIAEHDGRLWVARPSADGSTLVVSSVDGEPTTELDIGGYIGGVFLAGTSFGLVLTAAGSGDFRPQVWVSPDGVTWTESLIADRPMDVTGLTWTGSRLLAAGAERPQVNPGTGPFQPVLFVTTDGIDWREISLGVDTTDSWLSPVVLDGDRLVSSARIPVGEWLVPATIESLDSGETWRRVAGEDLAPESIGRAGDSLFGVNGSTTSSPDAPWTPLVVEADGGWAAVDLAATIGPHQYAYARILAGGPFGIVGIQFDRPIGYCFDDPSRCQPQSSFLRVRDGTADLLDLTALDIGWNVVATISDAGDLSLLYSNDDGLHVATWPAAAGEVPLAPPIVLPEPTGPPVIEWGDEIEVGAVYRYALYTHCGIGVLGTFGGRNWWIEGEPTAAYDLSQEGLGSLLGEIHVIAEDRIEYVLDGEVIAVYTPQDREIPGCE